MDPLAALSRSLRIERLQPHQDNRQPGLPFRQGQLIRGLVKGTEGDRFVLEINGEKYTASSQSPLRVGQRLDLQVTATSPRITLQIQEDPLLGRMGRSLHLLNDPVPVGQKITDLAGQSAKLPLTPDSRQVMDELAQLLSTSSRSQAPARNPATRLMEELSLFLSKTPVDRPVPERLLQEIGPLLAMIRNRPDSPPAILHLIGQITGELHQNTPLLRSGPTVDPLVNDQARGLLQQLNQGASPDEMSSRLARILLPLLDRGLTATPLLTHLLQLTVEVSGSPGQSPSERISLVPNGQDLRRIIDRLGLRFEQMLATGESEQARQTLKGVLMEMKAALEHGPAADRVNQLASTLELYQLLQVRLAQEALIFFPLPLPFLDQGFMLVQPDSEQKNENQEESRQARSCTLLLKLEGLGDLRIDLSLENEGLRARFYAQDKDRARFLAESKDELDQWLTATPLESVQFLTGATDPARELLARAGSGRQAIFETRA